MASCCGETGGRLSTDAYAVVVAQNSKELTVAFPVLTGRVYNGSGVRVCTRHGDRTTEESEMGVILATARQ